MSLRDLGCKVKAVVSLHVHPFAVAVAAFQENKTSGDGFLLQQESHPLTKDKWIFCLIGSGKLQPFPTCTGFQDACWWLPSHCKFKLSNMLSIGSRGLKLHHRVALSRLPPCIQPSKYVLRPGNFANNSTIILHSQKIEFLGFSTLTLIPNPIKRRISLTIAE